jgi:hypothetical protein
VATNNIAKIPQRVRDAADILLVELITGALPMTFTSQRLGFLLLIFFWSGDKFALLILRAYYYRIKPIDN